MRQKTGTISRRRWMEMGMTLGGLALSGAPRPAWARQAPMDEIEAATPGQGAGPFYPVVKPLDRDADLTRVAGRNGRAEGEVIHLMGRIVNLEGQPVPNASIELWQANTHGKYSHGSDPNPAPMDPNFEGYATQKTDEDGRFRFKTIKPGSYAAGTTLDPDARRPPHIHFDISGRINRLVTQMYFPGEPLNALDSLFMNTEATARPRLVATPMPPLPDMERDSRLFVWNIRLITG